MTDESLFGLGNDTLNNIESATLTGGISNNVIDANAFTLGGVTLIGAGGSDSLIGGNQNDTLIGVQTEDMFPGRGEVDTLTGRAGEDRFILGAEDWLGYDDQDPESEGIGDYARIMDFDPASDVIEVQGIQSDYFLETLGIETRLWRIADGQGANELICIIEGVTSLDLNSSAFVFVPVGSPEPEITIQGNGVTIFNNDNYPQPSDFTDFGSNVVATGTVTRTFTISNIGSATLSLTGIPHVFIDGAHKDDFTVTIQPSTQIAAGGTTSFEIQFSPSEEGIRKATIHIASDDSNEDPYEFSIQGSGTLSTTPEISIEGNGVTIVDGNDIPRTGDHTDFGSAVVTLGTIHRSFTIRNTGSNNLDLTGSPLVSISGTHANDFSVTIQPSSPIVMEGSTNFQIQFAPSAPGPRHAIISVACNDTDENPYDFVIQGSGELSFADTADQLVVAGGTHSCALTNVGGVKCWGYNYYGQVGDGTSTQRTTPVDVSGLSSGIESVTSGLYHTCALTNSGGVKCWGYNAYGQLGDGTTTQRTTPVDVSGLTTGVIYVAAGEHHTCALTRNGAVRCWGYNYNGQLGDGTTTNRSVSVASGLSTDVIVITAGGKHTCALTSIGGVKCWGYNFYGQLGDGTGTSSTAPVDVVGLDMGVKYVDSGDEHSCAITDIGAVRCWGKNSDGQLGDDTTTYRKTPVNVIGLTESVASVAAGSYHSCALSNSGGIMCWGDNGSGQLGDGTLVDRHTPVGVMGFSEGGLNVSAGDKHTCALTDSAELYCWGSNGYGRLGDGTTINRYTSVKVDGLWWKDSDSDGLLDDIEAISCTNSIDADSDEDGISDGMEDANRNGIVDNEETDPCNSDSDGDGIQDGTEAGISVGIADPDGAGPLLGTDFGAFISDADPLTTTDPTVADSDGDGYDDGQEDLDFNGMVDANETDPNDEYDYPQANCSYDDDDDGDVDGSDLFNFIHSESSSDLNNFVLEYGRIGCH